MHARARGLDIVAYCEDPWLRTTVDNLQARSLTSLSFAPILLRPTESEPPPNGISVAFETALGWLDAPLGPENAALDALEVLDAVGLTDRLEGSMALFSRVRGWSDQPDVNTLNRAHGQQPRVAALHLSEVAVLRETTAIDQVVYERATETFFAHGDAYGTDAEVTG